MVTNVDFKLSGRVDATNAQQSEDLIMAMLENIDQDFTIDLSELDYISSVGLRVFLKTAKVLKEKKKKLVLVKPTGPIHDLLIMSGFDKIIDIQL